MLVKKKKMPKIPIPRPKGVDSGHQKTRDGTLVAREHRRRSLDHARHACGE